MAVGSASCWRAVVIPLESELGRFEASTCGDGRHEVGAFGIYWTGKEVANHTLRVAIKLVAEAIPQSHAVPRRKEKKAVIWFC